jgi:Cys-tRNA synthase (O-phospho-L-seryl-tRNA:Cys-tRNA synthase)
LNSAQNSLDSLIEFNKLIQDELKYISEMEDIELTRDWSQPKKLKSSDLIQHKMVFFVKIDEQQQEKKYFIKIIIIRTLK